VCKASIESTSIFVYPYELGFMSSESPPAHGPSRYTLWIADRDEKGRPVDRVFIDAAHQLADRFFSYRQEEIGCESVTATLIQSSVNAASRAAKGNGVDNPLAYLLRVFVRKVDRFLSRRDPEVAVADDFLEDVASRGEREGAVEKSLIAKLLLKQALGLLRPDERELFELHIVHGRKMDEIAELKGEPANRLAVRLSRGLKRVARTLDPPDKRESKG